ncbi:hypothetical protein CLV51_11162 [Chitinophaga niastensis]|uniref:Uncharacterized protein n=1 Tax=Chitinophaga niastensis TaxID=536980 RepID=A0A2P8H8W8_CHINA|nr:hypothetical protein CLV51_11162 [Chitinophaga niastensis]
MALNKKDTHMVSFFFGANHASNAEYKIFISCFN